MALFGLFGRKNPALNRLKDHEWYCQSCGTKHRGMYSLGASAPDDWRGDPHPEPNDALRRDGDFLSDDFCVIGGSRFFVRGIFPMPVEGLNEHFTFGSWAEVPRETFDAYAAGIDSGEYGVTPPWAGAFANTVGFLSQPDPEPCEVEPKDLGKRPHLWLTNLDHPYARMQKQGVKPSQVWDIYRRHGHIPQV